MAKSRTTSYHPQSDDMIDRFKRTLQHILAIFVDKNRTSWNDQPYLTMTYSATVHESHNCPPCNARERNGTPPMQYPNW